MTDAPACLDPSDVGSVEESWQPSGPLPQSVRTFGFVPDFSALRPGDLVLTASASPEKISKAIQSAQQRAGYDPFDAQFSHAAIYLGVGEELLEANFDIWPWSQRGVQLASLLDYVGSHKLRFRRLPEATPEMGWRIAVSAMKRIGQPYSFGYLWEAWQSSLGGWWRSSKGAALSARKAHVCSSLYQDAIVLATGKTISTPANVCSPATLSHTPQLVDVPVSWRRIVARTPG